MKHKTQEALNYISDEYLETYREGRPKNKDTESLLLIQQFIDCQLTMEEISTISTAINHLEVDYSTDNLLPVENKSLKRIVDIRSKLLKQKEMWEEE